MNVCLDTETSGGISSGVWLGLKKMSEWVGGWIMFHTVPTCIEPCTIPLQQHALIHMHSDPALFCYWVQRPSRHQARTAL